MHIEISAKELANLLAKNNKDITIEESIQKEVIISIFKRDAIENVDAQLYVTNQKRKQILLEARIRRILVNSVRLVSFTPREQQILDEISEQIIKDISEFTSDKKLLSDIKKTLKKMKMYNASECASSLSDLLTIVFEKYENMDKYFQQFYDIITMAAKGINMTPANIVSDDREKYNERIDDSMMKLGLKK